MWPAAVVLAVATTGPVIPRGCAGTLQECRRIVTVINNAYSFADTVYARQMQSVVCYATRHGYGYDQLDPADFSSACSEFASSFFFAKHCAVAEYLRRRTKRRALVYVLDGDVAEANPLVRLQAFDHVGADITFYERIWNPEVMAGNYIARNTLFTRKFLRTWAAYFHKQPPGFSSADNGALHPALTAVMRGRDLTEGPCETEYTNLTTDVTNLTPYFNWVELCRKTLPPNTYLKGVVNKVVGIVFVAKKGTGFVADGAFLGWKTNESAGYPPLYHGVKDMHMLKRDNGCWKIVKN